MPLAAIVGEEHHDRIVGQLEVVELGQQAANVVVNVLHHAIDARQILRVVLRAHGMALGGKIRRVEVLGRVVLAIFIGTWCGACGQLKAR